MTDANSVTALLRSAIASASSAEATWEAISYFRQGRSLADLGCIGERGVLTRRSSSADVYSLQQLQTTNLNGIAPQPFRAIT